jgi:LmbE family N-acetylglucosaminyl deacetylase
MMLRRKEMAACAERLGLAPEGVRWAGLVDGELPDREDHVAELIRTLIAELEPQELYVTCAEDPHPDHAAAGRAARRAVAASSVPVTLLEYPVWLWNAWPMQRGSRFLSTVDAIGMIATRQTRAVRTGDRLPAKLHALSAHASQLRRPEGLPAGEHWPVLPSELLSHAGDEVELFLVRRLAEDHRRHPDDDDHRRHPDDR